MDWIRERGFVVPYCLDGQDEDRALRECLKISLWENMFRSAYCFPEVIELNLSEPPATYIVCQSTRRMDIMPCTYAFLFENFVFSCPYICFRATLDWRLDMPALCVLNFVH